MAEMRSRVQRRNAGDDAEPVAYGTYGSPTHHALYEAMNQLECGAHSWAFPSGLAACSLAIIAYVHHGQHVLLPDSVYWPTRRFCVRWLAKHGVEATVYDPRIGAGIERLMRATTRVVYIESPGSHTFEMQDIPAIAAVAHRHGATVVVDNTWATPLYCKPLRLGADVVVHAITKYIGGHSDLLMGTVTTTAEAWPALRESIHAFGPDDERRRLLAGVARTALAGGTSRRASRQCRATDRLVPGASGSRARAVPGAARRSRSRAVAARHERCQSGLFGVVLRDGLPPHASDTIADRLQLFGRGASWGGVESLVLPSSLERSVTTLPGPGRMLRFAAGLEAADDLIADLEQAFAALQLRGLSRESSRIRAQRPQVAQALDRAHAVPAGHLAVDELHGRGRKTLLQLGDVRRTEHERLRRQQQAIGACHGVLERVDARIAGGATLAAGSVRDRPADARQRARDVGVGGDRHPRVLPDQVQHALAAATPAPHRRRVRRAATRASPAALAATPSSAPKMPPNSA